MVRAARPVRTSPGPFWALRTSTRRVEVKSKSTTAGCPPTLALAVRSLASERPPLTLQGSRAGRGGSWWGRDWGRRQVAGKGVGKCSSANPSSVATQALLAKLGLQLSGVRGSNKGNPCAVGATSYPISGGEGDVTCELVTYERL